MLKYMNGGVQSMLQLTFSTESGVIAKEGMGISVPTVKNVDVVDHVLSLARLAPTWQ